MKRLEQVTLSATAKGADGMEMILMAWHCRLCHLSFKTVFALAAAKSVHPRTSRVASERANTWMCSRRGGGPGAGKTSWLEINEHVVVG